MVFVASLILALFAISSIVQAYFNYGQRANDYNFTLEVVKLDADGKPIIEDPTAKDPSVGHLQFSVYVLDPTYKTVDDAQVEITFTQCGETSAPQQLKSVGFGQYVGLHDIIQPGAWDFQATAYVPTLPDPIAVTFKNINFLGPGNALPCRESASASAKSAASASSLPWGLIGAVVVLLLVVVLVSVLKPKRAKKGT